MPAEDDADDEARACPFRPAAIDHVVLRVADLERSVSFYRDVIGCAVDRRRPDLGLVHMRAGSSMIDLLAIGGPIGGTGSVDQGRANADHVCLRIQPFDERALIAHLDGAGAEMELPVERRYGAEGTGPSLYLRDPDGNRIELKGPPDDGNS